MQKNFCLTKFNFILTSNLIVLFLILLFAVQCNADRFGDDVGKIINELSSKVDWEDSSIYVGIGSFFYGESKITSDFAYHFTSEVESAATSVGKFRLVSRKRLDEILKEQELQMTDLIDLETVKRIGKIKGLDAVLTGSYSCWGDDVRVKAKIIRIEDAQMCVVTESIGGIPENLVVKPSKYETHKERIEKIDNVLPEREKVEEPETNSDFHLTIEPGKTEPYREGENLTLYVKSEVDCYIEIYDIAPDGSTHLIFPNEFWLESHSPNDNFIKAGVRTPIPYDNSFTLQVFPPFGIETMKLIASTKTFSTRNRSFYRGKGFPKIGDIDHPKTVEELKGRVRTVLAQPGSSTSDESARVAQAYCTVLTK